MHAANAAFADTTLAIPPSPAAATPRQVLYHALDSTEANPPLPGYQEAWANNSARSYGSVITPAVGILERAFDQYIRGSRPCPVCESDHTAWEFAGRRHLNHLYTFHSHGLPHYVFSPEHNPWNDTEAEWCLFPCDAPGVFLDFNMLSGQLFVLQPPAPASCAENPSPPTAPINQPSPAQQRIARNHLPPPAPPLPACDAWASMAPQPCQQIAAPWPATSHSYATASPPPTIH